MALMFDHFPVFEANQVLTSRHLNDVFNYLDEQTRLTRSHLIGIGIVCGLEIKLDTSAGTSILLSKGCGVTSEGYLIIEFADASLVAYRTYTLPADVDYPPFKDAVAGTQFPLWELFAAGEPNTTTLNTPSGFLDDKAVLLFLELKKQDLRNCSPNNCDDKGAEVTATVRRLLIGVADLEKIIATAGALGSGLTASDLDTALSEKLNLPDIHVLRFDVLNSGPVTSNDVYARFLNVFRQPKLAQATEAALAAVYAAFKPLLQGAYPSNPFATFNTSFGFLDNVPASTTQVRFLQYYVDLFEDLLRAYDEFRWRGAELLCVCCPPDGLFPRHLMLGLLHPELSKKPANYRQPFLSSPAVGCCAAHTRELLQLFSRLVEMAARFSDTPSLPKSEDKARIDPQIRVTPSVLGDKALQTRAIPYYYRQNGAPPLYQLWNGEKTRRNRANQNLSYRYDEYNPAGPAFVSDPLRYDIEPYNFLRIEGHLGKAYQTVVRTLLLLKAQYRLPIDIVAVRTGPYDDTQPLDVAKEAARFQDLETLYDALREELLSSLAEGAISLYDVPIGNSDLTGGTPKLPLIKNHEPHYRYPRASVGAFYEAHLQTYQATPYIDVDQTLVSDPSFSNQVLQVYCTLFAGVNDLPAENYAHVVCIFYFTKLAEILPSTLDALAYADFENKYQDLLALVRYFRSDRMASVPADLRAFVPQEELIDQFDQVLFNCMLQAVKAVNDEYARRVSALRKKQFLSTFLQQHPGIQHKAGVPLGGTFIVVYHQEPAPLLDRHSRVILNTALFADAVNTAGRTVERAVGLDVEPPAAAADRNVTISEMADMAARTDIKALALTEAIDRIGSNKILTDNPDVSLLIGSLTGRIPMFGANAPRQALDDEASKIIAAAVNELADGTVIADFFLPYLVSSDCPGIEFVLPKSAPSFNIDAGCTSSDGIASVKVTAKGGTAPYDISVDQAGYQALGETLSLRAGAHTVTIRDAEGIESTPQSLVVPTSLGIGTPEYACENMQFRATFGISGGTMPYAVNGTALPADQTSFTTDPAPSGTSVTVVVTDGRNCSTQTSFSHTCPAPCTLPCAGISLRRGFRFWMPEPEPNGPFREVRVEVVAFTVENVPGKPIDVAGKIGPVLKAPTELTVETFPKAVNSWIAQINKIIANEPGLNESGKASWLTLAYESGGAGRLGTLWLEYFECLKFDIRLSVAFVRPTGEERLQVTYSLAGTSILARDVTTTVPPFDGTRIDKCNPGTPPVALCPKTPEMTLKIDGSPDGRTVRLSVTATPAARGLTFLWEVQDATPAIGNGDTFTTTFNSFGTKQVTVTAFTRAGCRATQSTTISIRG
jgi:hypothetical protein